MTASAEHPVKSVQEAYNRLLGVLQIRHILVGVPPLSGAEEKPKPQGMTTPTLVLVLSMYSTKHDQSVVLALAERNGGKKGSYISLAYELHPSEAMWFVHHSLTPSASETIQIMAVDFPSGPLFDSEAKRMLVKMIEAIHRGV